LHPHTYKTIMRKLKEKWNITSNLQFVVILLVFSLSGSSTLVMRGLIFEWIGITAETNLLVKVPLFILVIFPIYQALFLLIGALFGQFRFFWEFEKKMLSRLNFRNLIRKS